MIKDIQHCLFRLREFIRSHRAVYAPAYQIENIAASLTGRLRHLRIPESPPKEVALCLRFRDEARYLDEWISYHHAAGISHFFLYNNFSSDAYQEALAPHIDAGHVTLIDWLHVPASPAAEEDCIRRAIDRFGWVGFLDADEFIVIKDGRSIPELLSEFAGQPALALHWYYFGSNHHRARPSGGVINAYTRRAARPNRHVKCFVQPAMVTQNKNSHSWFFRRARLARNESHQRVFGSIGNPTAERAWINHYYTKSLEDYLEKAARKSTLDIIGIKQPSRQPTRADRAMLENNDIIDQSAIAYLAARRRCVSSAKPWPDQFENVTQIQHASS